MYKVQTR